MLLDTASPLLRRREAAMMPPAMETQAPKNEQLPTAHRRGWCPQCKREYLGGVRFCPEDGRELVEGDPYLGQVLIGQIEIMARCGEGAMGTVYRGWQRAVERQVAVKILRRDLMQHSQVVERFKREAHAIARLSHPNIVTVYLVGETEQGVPFLAMEFIDGVSLDQLCESAAPFAPERALYIAKQVASALAEAHGQGIVHRDLKPANVLLSERRGVDDFVTVLDFGIAKVQVARDESNLTQSGAIFGTPFYLSPEQAEGREVDHRCDLYSLAVMLYEMSTGRVPFDADSGVQILVQHIKESPRPPREIVPQLPQQLETLILRGMSKHPGERWASAEELLQALMAVEGQLFGSISPVEPMLVPISTRERKIASAEPAGLDLSRELSDHAPLDLELSHHEPLDTINLRAKVSPGAKVARGFRALVIVALIAALGAIAYALIRGDGPSASRQHKAAVRVDAAVEVSPRIRGGPAGTSDAGVSDQATDAADAGSGADGRIDAVVPDTSVTPIASSAQQPRRSRGSSASRPSRRRRGSRRSANRAIAADARVGPSMLPDAAAWRAIVSEDAAPDPDSQPHAPVPPPAGPDAGLPKAKSDGIADPLLPDAAPQNSPDANPGIPDRLPTLGLGPSNL